MTGSQAGSFAVLIGGLIAVAAVAVVGLPCLARMRFRDRLEAIRDDGVDAIIAGRLRQEEPVADFLAAIEVGGDYARWVTFARNVAILTALADLGFEDPRDLYPPPSYCELDGGERKIMHSLEERATSAFRSYLIWGSPLGWALAPIAVLTVKARPHGKVAKAEHALPAAARKTILAGSGDSPKATSWTAGSPHGVLR